MTDGVLPDDQRRSGVFRWPPSHENYVYEALQGALVQAVILQRAGYDAFNWQDKALLRAFRWLRDVTEYPATGDDTWALRTNEMVGQYLLEKLQAALGNLNGRTLAVLRLAYKPLTDDVRESRAMDFVRLLLAESASVQAYDPAANAAAAQILQDERLRYCDNVLQTATAADALVILTEWNEFRNLDFAQLRQTLKGDLILDSRNVLDPAAVVAHGYTYLGRGRAIKGGKRVGPTEVELSVAA